MNPIKLIKSLALILVIGISSTNLYTQPHYSARSLGAGEAGTSMKGVESVFTNPASITPQSPYASVATSTMPFSLPEFTFIGIGGYQRHGEQQWIFGTLSNLGTRKYRRIKAALGYGRTLMPSLNLAAEVSVKTERFEGYGTSVGVSYGIFLQQDITPVLSVALSIRNPIPIPMKAHLATSVNIGMAFQIEEPLTLYADISKQETSQWRFMTGLEYRLNALLTVRAGVATRPSTFHIGTSLRCSSKVVISSALRYHLTLGVSPAIDITFVP
jgi:long-subunit fatty acid transport protein